MPKKSVRLGCRIVRSCIVVAVILETCLVADVARSDRYTRRTSRKAVVQSESIPFSNEIQIPDKKNSVSTSETSLSALATAPESTPETPTVQSLDSTTHETPPVTQCYWFTDWNAARNASQALDRPLLIHFSTEYCGPCKRMEETVLTQETIQMFASSYFVLLKIEGHKDPATCQRFGVSAFPSDFIVSAKGEVLARNVGFQDHAKYRLFLSNAAIKVNLPPMTRPVNADWQKTKSATAHQSVSPYITEQETTKDDALSEILAPPALDIETKPKVKTDLETKTSMEAENRLTIEPATEEIDIFSLSPISSPSIDIQRNELEVHSIHAPLEPRVDMTPKITQTVPIESPAENAENTPSALIYRTGFASELPLLLDGYCPVTMVEKATWEKGKPQFTAHYANSRYCCASQAAYDKFTSKPEIYALVSDGMDIVLLTEENKRVLGTRRYGVRYGELNFVFATQENREKFRKKPEHYESEAQKVIALQGQKTIR